MHSHSEDVRTRVLNALHWDFAVPRYRLNGRSRGRLGYDVGIGRPALSARLRRVRRAQRSRRRRRHQSDPSRDARSRPAAPADRRLIFCRPRLERGSHGLQHAAVDEVGRADGIAGALGAEKDEEIRKFRRSGEPLDRRVLARHAVEIGLPVAALVGRELFGGLDPVGRQDEAGVDAIDANVVADELGRQHFENIISAALVVL